MIPPIKSDATSQGPRSMQLLIFPLGWTIEIDAAARRLTILKDSIIPWPTRRQTVVNYCTFDECRAVGTVPDGSEQNFDECRAAGTFLDGSGQPLFGVYLDFRGGREVIPVGPLSEASRLATELSVATGIPRHDRENRHRPIWGRSSDD